MKSVCVKYGVLLVFDEVMCGMGRTGYLHAWQKEGVVPDIQLIGKGIAGGYQALSGMLLSPEITDAIEHGSGFNHGHTFQNSPKACAAGLAVQKIIEEEGLLANVRDKGDKLQEKLEERLGSHRNVGNIRGVGLFRAVSTSHMPRSCATNTCSSSLWPINFQRPPFPLALVWPGDFTKKV